MGGGYHEKIDVRKISNDMQVCNYQRISQPLIITFTSFLTQKHFRNI